MCDDFFEDNFFAPDNDFEEDIADDANGQWYEDGDNLIDASDAKTSVSPDDKSDPIDLADAMLLGMIGGAFYDSAADEKRQLKRLKSAGKKKK